MPVLNDIHSIVVASANANFTAHTYNEVFASAKSSITINGVEIDLAAGQSIKLRVKSISSDANVFLLGETIDNYTDSAQIGW